MIPRENVGAGLLNLQKAAKYTGFSSDKFSKNWRAWEIHSFKAPGSRRRWHKADLDAFLLSTRQEPVQFKLEEVPVDPTLDTKEARTKVLRDSLGEGSPGLLNTINFEILKEA